MFSGKNKEEPDNIEVYELPPFPDEEWNFQHRAPGQNNIDKVREIIDNQRLVKKNARFLILEEGQPIKLYQSVYNDQPTIYEIV